MTGKSVKFTKEEFEKVLPTNSKTGAKLWKPRGFSDGEFVYCINVTGTNKRITIRSSVRRNGQSAASGNDSIRHWVEYKYRGQWWALGKGDTGKLTQRTEGWEGRMTEKLRMLWTLAIEDSKRGNRKSVKTVVAEAKAALSLKNELPEYEGVHAQPTISAVTQAEAIVQGFVPSEYQQAIFDFVANGSGNGMVEAVAGSGKTTTIVQALKLTSGSVLFCAFNKHIQMELASKAPSHVEVSTIHSIGFRALKTALPRKPQVDSSKLWGICKELLPERDQYPLRQPLSKMVSLAKKTLTDWTSREALEEMASYYGIELNGDADEIMPLVPKAMQICANRLAVIDFDDMIWLPIYLNVQMPKFDWVFVDEAQDLSKTQSEIVKRSLAEGGRILLVGDSRQSIYGFTGADCQSIDRLGKEFRTVALPLSISYRCPKSVVALAQRIVPQIQARENAPEGLVRDSSSLNWMSEVVDDNLVLCRVNAPLVSACYRFIRQGKKAVIRGRDIGKGLLNFIEKLRPMGIEDLLVKIEEYRVREITRLEKAGREDRIESIQDRCDTLVALCDGVADLTELRYNIKQIFDDKTKTGIILSSVHRSKGDQAHTVFILKPELMPHPLAKKDWQIVQEKNVEYVAVTRAMDTLVFVR